MAQEFGYFLAAQAFLAAAAAFALPSVLALAVTLAALVGFNLGLRLTPGLPGLLGVLLLLLLLAFAGTSTIFLRSSFCVFWVEKLVGVVGTYIIYIMGGGSRLQLLYFGFLFGK